MSSRSSSPIFGTPPRWLVPKPKGVTGSRQALKLLLVGLVCVLLGMGVANMFTTDDQSTDTPFSVADDDASSIYHETDRIPANPQQKTNLPHPHSSSFEHHKYKQKSSAISRIAEKLSSWNPLGRPLDCKPPKQDLIDSLGADHSINETKELVFDESTSYSDQTDSPPVIAKITIVTGDRNSIYERALRTHAAHNRIHGYPMHTLRESILDDVWSKPAYILSVILRELAKPEHERLQWLLWVDADTIIINPHVPAETFLPPPSWDDVHLLVCHDFNGLNNGVFPIRVHQWSVDLLSAILSYRHYRPREYLEFRDQSAMARLLETPKFSRHTILAPQRWFNAYQGEINETIAPFQTRPGDLLVHFAGVPNRDERMELWLERAEQHLPEWEIDFEHTSYNTEIREFWQQQSEKRNEIRSIVDTLRREFDQRAVVIKDALKRWSDDLTDVQKVSINNAVDNVYSKFEDENTELDVPAIQKAMLHLKEVNKPLQDHLDKHDSVLKKEAHNVLFAAENLTLSITPTSDTAELLTHLDTALSNLKDILLAKVFNSNRAQMQMERVKKWKGEVEQKLESSKEAEAGLEELENLDEAQKSENDNNLVQSTEENGLESGNG